MTRTSCPRLFEVEAARDGRLTGAELLSFERHVSACPVCSREAQALEAPAAALRLGSAGKRDELQVRRERTRLLASFDAELVVPQQRWGRWLLWPVPIAALVVGWCMIGRPRPAAPERAASTVVRASRAAEWTERTDGALEQIRLTRGSLWLHVDHSAKPRRRLLVILPDGELEDTGTTFTVSADGEHTTRVEVQDGSVLLKISGQLPVALGPGGTWSPSRASASPAASMAAAAAPTPKDSATQGAAGPRASVSEPATAVTTPAADLDPAGDFRGALATLDRGDNTRAAAAFTRFLAKHPHDPRAEDAAYLRVIALRRSGDEHGLKNAEQEYLRRYPSGFRHAEVEGLARSPTERH
jgi:hypothetical protein